jgi:hypothetical protein
MDQTSTIFLKARNSRPPQTKSHRLKCATGSVCEINSEGGKDHGAGALTFTGVSVVEPAGCTVASELTTNPLTDELIMDPSGGTATFDKFLTDKNAEGKEVPFITIKVSGCAAAGSYPVKGTQVGRTNDTGVSAASQPLTFNATEQKTGGGTLSLGSETATLTGSATNTLSGANAGKPWGGS